MEEETHNPSGKDVDHGKLWREQCEASIPPRATPDQRASAERTCDTAAGIGKFVDEMGMSPGDLLECFRQSLNVQSLEIFSKTFLGQLMTLVSLMNDVITKRPLADIGFTEKDPLVERVAKRIVEIFKGEGGRIVSKRQDQLLHRDRTLAGQLLRRRGGQPTQQPRR